MQHIPISYFGLMTVQEIAAYAGPAYELMLAVRTKAFDEALPKLPDLDCWQKFYHDHRSITRGLGNQLPSLLGMNGDDAQDLLDSSRAISNYEQVRPGVSFRLLRQQVGILKLRQLFRVALRLQPRLYKTHLVDLRRNLESDFRYQAPGEEDFGEALEKEPAVYFYTRVVLPALFVWQTTPQKLMRQVRSVSSEGKRSEAVERLVRLDPLAHHMPEVRAWCNVPNGQDRTIRREEISLWQTQGLGHGEFERTRFKALIGALIQSTVKRMGCYLDYSGQWHKADITAGEVRDLLHAVAKDRIGQDRGVVDQDIADMQLASWRRQLHRYRKLWNNIVPAHPGLELVEVESGGS